MDPSVSHHVNSKGYLLQSKFRSFNYYAPPFAQLYTLCPSLICQSNLFACFQKARRCKCIGRLVVCGAVTSVAVRAPYRRWRTQSSRARQRRCRQCPTQPVALVSCEQGEITGKSANDLVSMCLHTSHTTVPIRGYRRHSSSTTSTIATPSSA